MNATVLLMSKQEQNLRVNTQEVHVICPFLKKGGYDSLKSTMLFAAQHLFVWLEPLSSTIFTHSQ